jgi:hypothetical protein
MTIIEVPSKKDSYIGNILLNKIKLAITLDNLIFIKRNES